MNATRFIDISTRIKLVTPVTSQGEINLAVTNLRRLASQAEHHSLHLSPDIKLIEGRFARGVSTPEQHVELHCYEPHASRDWTAELMRALRDLVAIAKRGAVIDAFDEDGIGEAITLGDNASDKAVAELSHAIDAAAGDLQAFTENPPAGSPAICIGMDPLTNTAEVYSDQGLSSTMRGGFDSHKTASSVGVQPPEWIPERPSFQPIVYFDAIDLIRLRDEARDQRAVA